MSPGPRGTSISERLKLSAKWVKSSPRKECLRAAYRHERVWHGRPRERWVLYTLRLSLGDGFQVKRVRYREDQAEHRPDLRIYKAGRWVADVEVSGSKLAIDRLAREGVWVLPSKLAYARAHDPERYLYIYVLEAHMRTLDAPVLWATGRELLKVLEGKRAGELVGDVGHGLIERYHVFPLDVFHREWHKLVGYVLWLAGELNSPDPWDLANFMPLVR